MKTDMYPSGSLKLIQVKTNELNLQIFGDDLNSTTRNRRINRNTPAFIKVYSDSLNIELETLAEDYGLVPNAGNQMMPVFFENGKYDLLIENKTNRALSFVQNGINIDMYFKKINNIYLGNLNFKGDVGYTNLDIYEDNKKALTLIMEVFPSKMDYKKDYEEMISEINEEIASIAFNMLNKTYLRTSLVDTSDQTKTEFVNILEGIFKSFMESLNFIVKNFKHNIVEKERIVPIHKAKKVSKNTRDFLRTRPYLLLERNDGFINIDNKSYLPRKLVEIRKETTIDIFENQLIKYIIRDIVKRIENLEKILIKTNGLDYKNIIDSKYELTSKKKELNIYLSKYFRNISDIVPRNTMSLVFQMSPGYKDAYRRYKMLSKGLDLGDDLFKISPKKIYELYEMWCYIKLHKILYDLGYDVSQYGMIDYKDNGLYLRLNTDREASMIYEKDNQALRLWYNKTYSVPTTRQRPDTVLYIQNLNSKEKRTYLFDAKYRMKIDESGLEGPMEDDINVMHRYRDAIVSEMKGGVKYKYETFGAYVMFPCSNEEEFKNHKFYKTIDRVNIGAFPMLPGSTSLMEEHLLKILSESDLEAKESRVIVDEFDDYAKFKREDVMVVNALDKDHLDAYLKHKFYHIPKKQLSNLRLGVEYIAFYQPKKSFKDRSGIYYYGKIEKISNYLRSDCTELAPSSRKNQEYLRFDIEEIIELSPIEAYEIGPVILSYTSLYLLHNAQNMRELKVKSNLEMRVYKNLRKLADAEDLSLRKEVTTLKNIERYILGTSKIEILDGKYIKVNGAVMSYRELLSELEVENE